MAKLREKRPINGGCGCGCGCHDNVSNKTSVPTHILGSTDNSVDLYVSTPVKTKWIFKEEIKNERTGPD